MTYIESSKSRLTRRDLIKLGTLGAGALLFKPGVASADNKAVTDNGKNMAEAIFVEARSVAEAKQAEAYTFPLPVSFQPENTQGVKNVKLPNDEPGRTVEPRVPKNQWIHPMTGIIFMLENGKPKEWVWSYDWYYGDKSENLTLVQHAGEEGKMYFRQNHDKTARLVLGVGRMMPEYVDSQGKRHDLKGNTVGGPAMINIRTHPNVVMRAYNADTGTPLMLSGKAVEGVTSESGDIGFIFGDNNGRVTFVADLPVDVGLETIVWEGPHDRSNLKLNIHDIRPALTGAAAPAASVPVQSK